jgi:ribosomal protein L40E
MKKCAYCGRENPDDATYCRECGATDFTAAGPPQATGGDQIVSLAVEMPEPDPDVAPDQESALCTRCLFPNRPDAPWCKRCGASTSFSSIVGPVDAALASGHMWRGAVEGRPRLFVLGGVWFIFAQSLFVNSMTVFALLAGGLRGFGGFLLLWLSLAGVAVSFSILYRVTRNFFTIPKCPPDHAND